jgi:hypothetical protein
MPERTGVCDKVSYFVVSAVDPRTAIAQFLDGQFGLLKPELEALQVKGS